jgi:putative FmdB family regulatory protein
MPIFEYKCNDCGHTMEFLEKQAGKSTRLMADKHICEKCKSENLQKLFSGFSVGRSEPPTPGCRTCPGGPYPTGTCPTCPSAGQL